MNKYICVLTVIVLLGSIGCTGIKTSARGLDNEAFLEFIGKPENYKGGVNVDLDNKKNFKAEIIKDYLDHPKGHVYSISTGQHILTISYDGKIIYKRQIFASSQETKKIVLP